MLVLLVELFVMLLELIFLLQTHPTLFDLYIQHMSRVDVSKFVKSSLSFMTKSLVRLVLKFLQYLPVSDKFFFFTFRSTSNIACNKKSEMKNYTNILRIILKIADSTLAQLLILIDLVFCARLLTMLAR